MKFADTYKLSSQVATAFVATKVVRLIAGHRLAGVVYARINARRHTDWMSLNLKNAAELSPVQKVRVVVAESIYLSMRAHPLMWVLAAGCACFWIVSAIKAMA